MNKNNTRGVSVVELVIVITILSILSLIVLVGLKTFRENVDLESVTRNTLSTLQFAQTRTLASESDTVYGVHFENDRYVLFRGGTYDPSASTNETHLLPTTLEFVSWSLGGGDDVIYQRVTGGAAQTGTIILRVKGDPARSRTLTVASPGQVANAGSVIPEIGTRITDTRHAHYILGWSMASSTTMTLLFPGSPNVTENIPIQNYINGGKFDWSGTVSVSGSGQTMRIHTHLLDSFNTTLSVHRERDENTRAVNISVDGKLITSYSAGGTITLGPFGGTMQVQ